jgi:CheY-like chemotaxis protein/HPt (histidine-containing phosphotransfer) domain-containing protein
MHIELIEFSLESTLRDTMRALATRAHQKNLELLLHVAPDVPDRVQGDPGRLRQVIVNLVGNAIKFTEHGEIEVSVRRESGAPACQSRLLFSVRDTGIGIATDKFQAIFDSFSQADTSTTRKYGGTGLGLTISAQLVTLMGGKIQLESTLGAGSRFYFSLDMPIDAEGALASYQQSGRIAGMPVLVVDDNESNRRLMLQMLRNWQMLPTAVASGEAALTELARAQAAGQPYPLALLDVQMPGMDGFELARRIQQDATGAASIMMITSQGQRGDAQRCRDLGLAAYLNKPVTQSDLLDAIMTTLGEPGLQSTDSLVTRHTLREHRTERPPERQLNLLLAEDNLVNQRLASILLEQRGHTLSIANNGREALDMWQAQAFDAILMDVDMPEMNGFEATQHIRALEATRGGHIPIVAMTAHAMQGIREECLAHGMDSYLSKPINVEALGLELQKLLAALPLVDQAPGQPLNSGLAVADFAQLRETVGDDRDLFDDLVRLYRTDAPTHRQRLQDALQTGDSDALRHSAHALQGMLGVFAAERSVAAAQRLEDHADSPDRAQAAQTLLDCLDEFDQALQACEW